MLAWLVYYRDGAEHNRKYIEFYMDEGKKLGIDFHLLLVEDITFGVRDGSLFLGYTSMASHRSMDYHQSMLYYPSKDSMTENQRLPDFVVFRAIYPLLSKHMELMGIPVYNNSFVSEICNDKAKTYQYLAKTGIPMVDSAFYKNCQLKDQLQVTDPTVIKAVDGHGGSQVFLLEDQMVEDYKADEVIKGIGNSDFVVQPLIGTKAQDLRVYVIGSKIIAAVLRTSREGFRSNYSLGGHVQLYQLSEKEEELVHTIIREFDFGLVGIDFIIDDRGELIFNEIEDVVGSRMLYRCSDINIVELYLKFILEDIVSNKKY